MANVSMSNSLNICPMGQSSAGYASVQLTQPGPTIVRNDFHLPKEKELMRGLFEVFIVDPQSGGVNALHIVARDESTAKVKALSEFYPKDKKDLDDYDYVIRRLGDVREKTPKSAATKALE